MIKIRCLSTGTWIFHGVPSRNVYIFNDENNHILEVEEADIPDLFAKKQVSGGCCGIPRSEQDLFEIIDE